MIATDELIAPMPKKANKKLWLIFGAAVGILICLTINTVAAVIGIANVAVEKPSLEIVLDSFMKSMAAKDFQEAYTLFSPNAQEQFPVSQLREMTEGNNFALFDGYQSLSVQNIKITTNGSLYHPDLPQEIVATVTSVTFYDNGFQGTLDGALERVDGKWQLYSINVTVPPDKFSPGAGDGYR